MCPTCPRRAIWSAAEQRRARPGVRPARAGASIRRRRRARGGRRRGTRRRLRRRPRRAWRASAMSPPWWPRRREAMLHAHLVHSVHVVRFAPPVIELRPQPEAPQRPRRAARRAAGRGDRHALDHRAVHRRGRADAGRAGHRRRCGAPHGRRRSSAGARDHGRIPRRADRHGARHRRRRLWPADRTEVPDAEPSDEMEFDE